MTIAHPGMRKPRMRRGRRWRRQQLRHHLPLDRHQDRRITHRINRRPQHHCTIKATTGSSARTHHIPQPQIDRSHISRRRTPCTRATHLALALIQWLERRMRVCDMRWLRTFCWRARIWARASSRDASCKLWKSKCRKHRAFRPTASARWRGFSKTLPTTLIRRRGDV